MTDSQREHITAKFREIKRWIERTPGFLDDDGLKSCYVIASTAEGASLLHDEEEFALVCARFAEMKADQMDAEDECREGR